MPEVAPKPGQWIHREADSLAAFTAKGIARALSGDWSGPGAADDLRAYTLQRALMMASLVGSVTPMTIDASPVAVVAPSFAPVTDERTGAVAILNFTAELLARDMTAQERASIVGESIETQSAALHETGMWPIVLGAVAVGIAQFAAVAYVAKKTAEVVDRQLQRNSDLRMLVQQDAQVLEVVRSHQEKEAAAGKPLPLDDASRAALNGLAAQQQTLVSKQQAPLSKDDGGFFSGLGIGAGTAAVLAAAAVVLFMK